MAELFEKLIITNRKVVATLDHQYCIVINQPETQEEAYIYWDNII